MLSSQKQLLLPKTCQHWYGNTVEAKSCHTVNFFRLQLTFIGVAARALINNDPVFINYQMFWYILGIKLPIYLYIESCQPAWKFENIYGAQF